MGTRKCDLRSSFPAGHDKARFLGHAQHDAGPESNATGVAGLVYRAHALHNLFRPEQPRSILARKSL